MNGFFKFISYAFLFLVFAFAAFAVYSGFTSDVSNARSTMQYTITITSDPPGASVFLDGGAYRTNVTPIEIDLSEGEHSYRVAFEDYEDEFNLYKPYQGKLNVTEDDSISVWLDRRTAGEIDELKAIDRERAEAAYAVLEAELNASRVYYRIETNCSYGANLTYMNVDGNITQQNNMGDDWYYFFVPEPSQYLSLSAQNQCDGGVPST